MSFELGAMPTPSRAGLRDRVLLLRSVDNFIGLDEESLATLAEQSQNRTYKQGEEVLVDGAAPVSMQIIIDGQVTIARKNTPQVLTAGDRFGALAVLAGLPNRRIVADLDTRTLEIPAVAFRQALEENFWLIRNGLRLTSGQQLRAQGGLPAAPAEVELGVRFERPRSFAERLLKLREGLFATMNMDAVVDLARTMTEVRVPVGELLWSANDPATHAVFIDYGCVRCTAPDGRHVDVGSAQVPGFLDVLSLQPRKYEARAETDVIGYRMSGEDILAILEIHVHVALGLFSSFARKLIENE